MKPGDPNPVSFMDIRDSAAGLRHRADCLMSWNQWEARVGKFSLHNMEIGATDPADVNFDENLACLWNRNRPISEM